MPQARTGIKGRGAWANPANRFEPLWTERDPDWDPTEDPAPRTQFYRDTSGSIISHNDSPDVGFRASINVYRGCEHGCSYCYARPTHEYLRFSAGLDFETRIMVKLEAPELLRRELASPRWQPQTVALSGVTDAYQPVERRLKLTRRCLEVFLEFRNPVSLVTKNCLITRDVDLLKELARFNATAVFLTVTTLDRGLAHVMEPRTSAPKLRLEAITTLAQAGVPVGVMVAPVVPGLTDHEIPTILRAAAKAGAQFAGCIVLRLPHGVAALFEAWLERHVPEKKEKVLGRLRALRGGALDDPRCGTRMRGEGVFAEQISHLFHVGSRKAGIDRGCPELSTASFRRPGGVQTTLFDGDLEG